MWVRKEGGEIGDIKRCRSCSVSQGENKMQQKRRRRGRAEQEEE